MGGCGEMWGDVGRCGEIEGWSVRVAWKDDEVGGRDDDTVVDGRAALHGGC